LGQTSTTAAPLAKIADNKEEASIFNNISSIIDKFHGKFGKKPPKLGERIPNKANEKIRAQAERAKAVATQEAKAAGKTLQQAEKIGQQAAKKVVKTAAAAAVKSAARKSLAKSLGKVLAKSIPFIGVAAGAVFAVQALMKGDYTSAGLEVAGSLVGPVSAIPMGVAQSITETYFDLYGVDYATDAFNDPKGAEERLAEVTRIVREEAEDMLKNRVVPKKPDQNKTRGQQVNVTKQEASDLLNRKDLNDRDLDGFGGRKYLEFIAGVAKPEPVGAPIPAAAPITGTSSGPVMHQQQIRQVAQEKLQNNIPPPPTPGAPPLATGGSSEPLVTIISPAAGKQAMIDELNRQGITDPTKRAAIMAQAAEETGGFRVLSEDLRYSASRMKELFGRLRNTPLETIQEAIKQGSRGIGNLLYGGDPSSPSYAFGAKQLGNVRPDDGFKYRGRGFLQLTGRANYKRAGVEDDPEKLLQLQPAAETAVSFASKFKGDFDDITSFTKFVNGGTINLDMRKKYYDKFKNDPSITSASVNKTSPNIGSLVGDQSTAVAAAKKDAQAGGNVTIVAVDNTQTIKRTTQRSSSGGIIPQVG
jgi:predicted chitinase